MFHKGSDINSGHYIGEVKTLNAWWKSNDFDIPIKIKTYTKSSKDNYVLLYKKISQYTLMIEQELDEASEKIQSLKL